MRICLIVLAGFCLGTAHVGAQVPIVPVSAESDETSLERQTFSLVNRYRQENDLPALAWDSSIAAIARGHSRDMATGRVDFGHDGFNDRMNRLQKTFLGMQGGGENVLMTNNPNDLARTALTLWLRSPPHLHNIRGDYNYSGMGVWVSRDGVIYFTQIFVRLQPPAQETQAASPPASPFILFPQRTVP